MAAPRELVFLANSGNDFGVSYQRASTAPTVRNAWFVSWYWNCWRSIGARLQGASELVLAAESRWGQLSYGHANELSLAVMLTAIARIALGLAIGAFGSGYAYA